MDKESLGIVAVIFLAFLMSGAGHIIAFTLPDALHGGSGSAHGEPASGNDH